MQQYYDWRMEAEESFTMFALQAAAQLKTGLGQAAAGALVYGQSFKKAMKDMIKQIAAMYVAWAVEKLAANALSKLLMKQETSAVAAQGTAMAEALAPAAWAKLVVSPGVGGNSNRIVDRRHECRSCYWWWHRYFERFGDNE